MADPMNLAKQAAKVAADKKATRILVMDLNGKSDVCRYKMIC